MPGMFGGIGCADPRIYALLSVEFSKVWGDSQFREGKGWALGGHAFGGRTALVLSDRCHYVIDGAYSIYEDHAVDPSQFSHDFRFDKDVLRLGPEFMGNVALIDTFDQTLDLAVEWSGTFPLYFVQYEGGVLFSSHLRPLARVTQKSVDNLGLLEFLRNGFTFGGRSMFIEIQRVLPGQSIHYSSPGGRVRVSESSRAWTTIEEGQEQNEIAERAWQLLDAATRRSVTTTTGRIGLMMSGGWDSRTLLAALNATGRTRERVICYSHGDTASRELDLVARLASVDHVDYRLEPIDDRVLDLDDLELGFTRAENVVFPHWHRAGRLLKDTGVVCAMAGVFGEVLGGHYGPSMLLSGRQTIMAVASNLLGRRARHDADIAEGSPETLLRVKPFGHHWYLNREFEADIPSAADRINDDVDIDVARLRRRGVGSPNQLVEAFIAEHRGSHYINAQLLSCRAHVDIVLPFAEQGLLAFVSCLPLYAKIHNALNRRMLRRHAPRTLRLPMAATLLPAGAPLLLQEASRFVRRAWEDARFGLHDRTHGRVGAPKLGWVNFEFVRSGNALMHLVEDLQSDIWDRDAIRERLTGLAKAPGATLYPVFNQLAKVYTVDLLCR